MTRQEIQERHDRVMARIKRNGFPKRPISAADRKRFDELKAAKDSNHVAFTGDLHGHKPG
jgi:hypothetical protein